MVNEMYNIQNYYEAFHHIQKASGWKMSTKKYKLNLTLNILQLINHLQNGTYTPSAPTVFKYNERGKLRVIESYNINDRLVMDVLCNKILLPLIKPKLIYDNSASLKDRGTSHFNRRLLYHLKDYVRQYGTEGYILVGDFKKYFDNLCHQQFLQTLANFGVSSDVLKLVQQFLSTHRIYLDGLTNIEQEYLLNNPFDSVQFLKEHPERYNISYKFNKNSHFQQFQLSIQNSSNYIAKSMGIGGQLAQLAGVVGAYRIDNYCKIVCSQKYYGRYMDDFYLISHNKEELQLILKHITQEAKDQGLFLNLKKTQIISLSKGFTILKNQYKLRDNNIYIVPSKDRFVRERRKLKKFKNKLVHNCMLFEDIFVSYQSWRGNIIASYGMIPPLQKMDQLFNQLFVEDWRNERY